MYGRQTSLGFHVPFNCLRVAHSFIRNCNTIFLQPFLNRVTKSQVRYQCHCRLVQSSPIIWSTDIRSTRLFNKFLAGPNHRTLILISNPVIRSARLYGQFLAGPNHRTLILIINLVIRSARLYGQFSWDKTLTLEAGSTVHK